MTDINNKELLLEAIDNYDVYKPQGRAILKTLIIAAREDFTVHLSIKNLYELSKVSKQGAYNTLKYLENDKIINKIKIAGNRISLFSINQEKLQEIINYYQTVRRTKNTLRKL